MILLHWKTKEEIEITTPKELKELLTKCNPTILKKYITQVNEQRKDIKISGVGSELKILKRRENV